MRPANPIAQGSGFMICGAWKQPRLELRVSQYSRRPDPWCGALDGEDDRWRGNPMIAAVIASGIVFGGS